MSIKALQEYTRVSKYASYSPKNKRREKWDEQVDRVFDMHKEKLGEKYDAIKEDFEFAKQAVISKKVLGSQRALQFGGKAILQKHARLYNCTATYADRVRFFQECMWLLLCGCGVGFSVQKHHVEKLPNIAPRTKGKKTFVIPDSIEGWADSIGVLMSSFFAKNATFMEYNGFEVDFDFSLIRPCGAPISSGSKAPGPDGLKAALIKIEKVLNKAISHSERLRPIDVYDIVMHASDAVLSGGIRRSACICLFSYNDTEMINAKTGSWFIENPQRGRSNNSAVLIRNEISKKEFSDIMESVKEFGEPGFIWSDNAEGLFNPCVEINLYGHLHLTDEQKIKFKNEIEIQNNNEMLSGWQVCNLCEINVKKAKTEEEFYEMCRAAAIIGTIQASYTDMGYLGEVSAEIIKKEALLGCSMTGMADNPEISFEPKIQKKGAKIILDENERIAALIGINKCARATCIKPAGSTSCVLGTASGIHPHHAKRYFRRVQANKTEATLAYFEKFNPDAVEESVWSANKTDKVISFLCEVPDGAKTKNQVDAITLLEHVKSTQQNWVEFGTRYENCVIPSLRHNVSNTINIKPEEWTEVTNYIYNNRAWFAGISLLPVSGDKDYPQAPFCAVYTQNEIVKEYGPGALFASGLIVDGLRVFDNNLWAASDCVLGYGENLGQKMIIANTLEDYIYNGEINPFDLDKGKEIKVLIKLSDEKTLPLLIKSADELASHMNFNLINEKLDWVRRAKQFAFRYFENDEERKELKMNKEDYSAYALKRMTYCLKDVVNFKKWCDLSRTYVDVNWDEFHEERDEVIRDNGAGSACAGGQCELGDLGVSMQESLNDKKAEKIV